MMASASPGDPRAPAEGEGVTPTVALPRGGPSWIVIAIGMAILGVLLFSVLDARRRAITAPSVRPEAGEGSSSALSAAPPPLYVPPAPAPIEPRAEPTPAPPPPAPAPQPQIVYVPQPAPPQPAMPAMPETPARVTTDPALVVDTTTGGAPAASSGGTPGASDAPADASGAAPGPSVAGNRVRASQFANRATTVPQGTLIPATLETGLDSTRPGLARAIVSKDVRGFDGTKILIPRGSRLIGEYRSDVSPGQNRALVNWIRLIRPDGVTIAIGSPASDPVGRGGIKAKVDSHFFTRFAGAILQSSLDVGVNLASRSAGSPVIVALPGTVQTTTQPLTQNLQQVTPTLKVKPGTSITIFVARDLDFTGSDSRP